MKAAALKGALSDRARAGRIHVVESLAAGDKPSTKTAVALLNSLAGGRRQLVVLQRDDALTWLSLRNVPNVHILAVDQLNTYDVLLSDDVIFTKGAYDAFVGVETEVVEEKPAKKAAAKKAAQKAETDEAPAENPAKKAAAKKAAPKAEKVEEAAEEPAAEAEVVEAETTEEAAE
jgi:large subunit ribosomal protein L4